MVQYWLCPAGVTPGPSTTLDTFGGSGRTLSTILDTRGRSLTRRWIAAATILLILVGGSPRADAAEGAPSEAVLAEARDAFRLGSALARQQQWVEALAAFVRSDALRAHAVTTYNIGYCERSLAHYTRARAAFQKALEPTGADFGKLPDDLAAEARGYLDAIDRRLVRAVVTLPEGESAIAVDGRPLEVTEAAGGIPELVAGTRDPGPPERAPAATFRLVLDPGPHVFVVSREGEKPRVLSRVFEPGETPSLSFVEPREPRAPARPQEPSRAAAYVAFGFGAVGLTVGAITGGLALAKKGELDDVCPEKNRCPAAAQGDIDALGGLADASSIALVVGATGAGLGTVLFFTATPEEASTAEPSMGLWIAPSVAFVSTQLAW